MLAVHVAVASAVVFAKVEADEASVEVLIGSGCGGHLGFVLIRISVDIRKLLRTSRIFNLVPCSPQVRHRHRHRPDPCRAQLPLVPALGFHISTYETSRTCEA